MVLDPRRAPVRSGRRRTALYAHPVASSIFFASTGEHSLVVHVEEELQDLLDAAERSGVKLITVTETNTKHKVLVNPSTIAFVRQSQPAT